MPYEPFAVCKELQAAGYQAYVVGGAVRDHVWAKEHSVATEPHDYDVATSAKPEEVQALFAHTVPTGLKYGTVSVLIGKERIEVTTFRIDCQYADGRHPEEVIFAPHIVDDLARRDFTMNAMAYDPVKELLVDPFHGQHAIHHLLIECVGEPRLRFEEDALRLLRAVRFAAQLGCCLEEKTEKAIKEYASSLSRVSVERIRDELTKTLITRWPDAGLLLLEGSGLLAVTLPELLPMVGHLQNKHHGLDVWGHTVATVRHVPNQPILRWAALLHDVGKPASAAPKTKEGLESLSAALEYTFYDHDKLGADLAKQIMRRLKFPEDTTERVVRLVRFHMMAFHLGWKPTGSAIRRFIRRLGPEHMDDLFALFSADAKGAGTKLDYEAHLTQLRTLVDTELARPTLITKSRDLAINGHDVMAILGLAPGPQIGVILRQLEERCIEEPELNTREQLIKLVEEAPHGSS